MPNLTRLAVLDGAVARRIAPWPTVTAQLLDRVVLRARQLAVLHTVNRVPRVFPRLLIVCWLPSAGAPSEPTAFTSGCRCRDRRRVHLASVRDRAAVGERRRASRRNIRPGLATYTAVLVSDTAVPTWHEARRELLFASSAAASAGAAGQLLSAADRAGPARRMAVAGAPSSLPAPGAWSIA